MQVCAITNCMPGFKHREGECTPGPQLGAGSRTEEPDS